MPTIIVFRNLDMAMHNLDAIMQYAMKFMTIPAMMRLFKATAVSMRCTIGGGNIL